MIITEKISSKILVTDLLKVKKFQKKLRKTQEKIRKNLKNKKIHANIYMSGIQETFEALGHFLYRE